MKYPDTQVSYADE